MSKIDTIKDLIMRLNKYRDSYYNRNESLISDKEYDNLFDKLVELEKETNIVFSNSPTQTVGYSSVSQLKKVKHNHPLLSLGKTTDIAEFTDYFDNHDSLVMAKLDGLTCSLLYSNGEFVRAESRGDGETGEDITHNAKVFANLPMKIPFDGDIVVDGECIITYDEFNRINERENTEYKNPRNLVSGSVRQLNSEIAKNRNIIFIAWRLHSITMPDGSDYPIKSHSESFSWLKDYGFDVVPYVLVKNGDISSFEKVIDSVKVECESKTIPIDGAVGMFDNVEYGNSLGRTGHHPRHSLAFKFYQEDNETTLLDIEWSTSRTGLVNPVAIFEPTEIDGTTVTRATLNNVSIIKELELGIGDRITVIKANQIIPKVTQNLTRSNTYKIPTECPVCGSRLVIKNDNGREMLYCTNNYCPAIIHDKIANFATRDGMNIVGISEERLRSLMDMGFVTDFASLYNLYTHRNEIAKEKGWGDSSIDSLLQAIDESKKCKLQNVIIAIGIPGIGKSAAKSISEYINEKYLDKSLNLYKTFLLLALDNHDWSTLPGFGKNTSDSINQYVKENYNELESLVHIIKLVGDNVSVGKVPGKHNGKTFCITGKLEHFDNRNALVYDIESNGGIVVSGVSAKTNYLITNDKNSGSSKNKAAEKYGTKIISELEYIMGQL